MFWAKNNKIASSTFKEPLFSIWDPNVFNKDVINVLNILARKESRK